MFYQLIYFSDGGDFFNLFRYITFRSGGAFFTALIFGFVFGQPLINLLKRTQGQGQPIRDDGPERHKKDKKGTPTITNIEKGIKRIPISKSRFFKIGSAIVFCNSPGWNCEAA